LNGLPYLVGKPEEKAGAPKKEAQTAPAQLEQRAKEIEARSEGK
jgi:hypothetical protein